MLALYLVSALILHSECLAEENAVKDFLPIPVIGAYFNRNGSLRQAFSLAVRTVNKCTYEHDVCEAIYPTPAGINRHLYHQVEFHSLAIETEDDPISLYNKFGELAGVTNDEQDALTWSPKNHYGLSMVIGPQGHSPSDYVQSLCEMHDIPQAIIRRELDREHDPVRSINFYPDTETLATVYIEMLKKLNWTSFSILYERTDNFLALDNVLKMYDFNTHYVYAYKLGSGPDYSETLLRVKKSKSKHKHFLIDCGFDVIGSVLKQAQQIGIMTDQYRYVVTTLDLHAVNLYPYQYSGANISGLQLVDVHNPFVHDFVNEHLDEFGIAAVEELQVKDAVMFDVVALYAQAYKDLTYQRPIKEGAKLPKDYSAPFPWRDGLSLRNYMLATEINGLTGPVAIDGDGVRRRFKLDVVNLHQTGLVKVGEWNFEDGFGDLNLLKDKNRPHYRVLITLTKPYGMKVNHSTTLEGNARYEGFVVDLIKELGRELNFDYTFYVLDPPNNGECKKANKTEKCTCTGMMAQILNDEVDMAVTDLTLTEDRALCVQFSTPFMNLGMSILSKKPQKAEATWYSFFAPFNYKVWLYMALTYLLISLLFYALGRLSPPEWMCPYPCMDEPTELYNQFTISNAFWFTMGSKMQQGSEIAPIGYSTRILAGWWWFFCLIMVNSYIANLAAFLTIETPVDIIKSIDDLFDQTEIKFGAKLSGSTLKYFESSSNPKYRRLYAQMMEDDWKNLYLVKENEDGIELAKRNDINYAFLMESSTIEYATQRHCDLRMTGEFIDQKSYAIAYAKNFSRHQDISKTISMLQEALVLSELKEKWWNTKGAICGKKKKEEAARPTAMTIEQLKGVFYVLAGGLLLSVFVTAYEFVQNIRSVVNSVKMSFFKVAKMELKIATQSKPIKPVLIKQISMETELSDSYSNNLTVSMHA